MRAYQERPEQAKAELRSAQTVERTTAAADGLPAGRKRPRATVALQRSNGNAAVHRLLEQAGWLPADPHRHTPASDHAGTTPTQRSTAPDVLRSMGTPLAPAVRRDMEQRFGVDFSGVRLHTGPAARRSAAEIRARAYTCGNHVVIGEGGGDRHTLAHELAHVIQQRRGPVAGTEQGSGLKVSDPSDRFEREAEATATSVLQAIPTPASPGTPDPAQADGGGNGGDGVLQRTITFAPFAHTTPMPVNLNHYWNQTDLLISPGLTYANGGTVGNALYLEKLLNNSGGGSNPGEPKDIEEMRLIDVNLVRARGQTRAATAMHAINGDFVNGANNTPDNIFMGSAKSNTQEHFHKVERPIRSAMQSGKHGLVAAYETMMATQSLLSFRTWGVGVASFG